MVTQQRCWIDYSKRQLLCC